MRRAIFLLLTALPLALPFTLPFTLWAAEAPVDVDPNTKTEGGADLRGSGANAGAPEARAVLDFVVEPPPPAERGDVAGPDAAAAEKDKPISARKPRERELEDASKGLTKPQ